MDQVTAATECPSCGSTPMGSGCYHICPNSDSFYSPEQERYDDQFYGQDDMSERYAGELVGLEDYPEDPEDFPLHTAPPLALAVPADDDIPF